MSAPAVALAGTPDRALPLVRVRGLRKNFGLQRVLNGIDLDVWTCSRSLVTPKLSCPTWYLPFWTPGMMVAR